MEEQRYHSGIERDHVEHLEATRQWHPPIHQQVHQCHHLLLLILSSTNGAIYAGIDPKNRARCFAAARPVASVSTVSVMDCSVRAMMVQPTRRLSAGPVARWIPSRIAPITMERLSSGCARGSGPRNVACVESMMERNGSMPCIPFTIVPALGDDN
jgi:hypothetical protein